MDQRHEVRKMVRMLMSDKYSVDVPVTTARLLQLNKCSAPAINKYPATLCLQIIAGGISFQ
jgi:hypothetical protein